VLYTNNRLLVELSSLRKTTFKIFVPLVSCYNVFSYITIIRYNLFAVNSILCFLHNYYVKAHFNSGTADMVIALQFTYHTNEIVVCDKKQQKK